MRGAYYNEIDPFCCKWLRSLIAANLIAPGDVDERSIEDVNADDLRGYVQCHFFAGIGGWSYALRLAGWPDNDPVWTGSCPCQPFSSAGKLKGFDDERHLWPTLFRLVQQSVPATIFGEQVAGKSGMSWLSLVQADMEACGYAIGAADIAAAGAGAPQIRQRLYWVADSETTERRRARFQANGGRWHEKAGGSSGPNWMACSDVSIEDRKSPVRKQPLHVPSPPIVFGGDTDWIQCRDGYTRPIEGGTLPMGPGLPKRMGKLRGFGNAIDPRIASEFITAYMECQP